MNSAQLFRSPLYRKKYTPAMDGKGSWRDNVRMERFWRMYKYELFNLYDDVTQKSIEQRLKTWMSYYNSERLHSSLGNKTPEKWREEHQSDLPHPLSGLGVGLPRETIFCKCYDGAANKWPERHFFTDRVVKIR